ncbi:MAG TPA: hypothetical protein VMU21_00120 [Thermodesulfovibrionales bacterium]|nr:hypothetical protein [Thermodesulfovibrionales bacterium]
MDSGLKIIPLAALFSLTIAINFPFGYFRRRTKRYSFKWFLYIHIPIPLIFLMRTLSHLDFRYIPLFVLAAVIGQLWGGRAEF